MQIVIDIDEEDYERLKEYKKAPFCSLTSRAYEAIANGTPLPDNATNGDVIKTLYGGMQINDPKNENDLVYIEHLYFGFPKYWWDAPYKVRK